MSFVVKHLALYYVGPEGLHTSLKRLSSLSSTSMMVNCMVGMSDSVHAGYNYGVSNCYLRTIIEVDDIHGHCSLRVSDNPSMSPVHTYYV